MKNGVREPFAYILAAAFLVWATVPVSAQISRATILGQVKDVSGAVVKGASIAVVSTTTGLKREVQSGGDGTFAVTDLQPGPYRVTVTQSGFGAQEREVSLLVGQSADLIFTLSPAVRAETLKVEAETPLVETNTATVHKNITP